MVKSEEKKVTAHPGKAMVRFKVAYSGHDFSDTGEARQFYAGNMIEVDVAKAKQMQLEHGAGCPFDIVSENKAIGGAPETK